MITSSIPAFTVEKKLSLFVILFLICSASFAQNTDQPLTLSMNTGWQQENPAVSNFHVGDYVPITGFLNRNAYIYFFEIRPSGAVRLNFPSSLDSYDPNTTENVIWGGEGQIFVRFVSTNNDIGLWNYLMIASLEPLTKQELGSLNNAPALANLSLSTEWFVALRQQAQIGTTSSFTQQQKESSGLWESFLFIRENNLFNY